MPVIPRNEIILGGRTQIPNGIYGVQIDTAEVKTGQKENAQPTLRITAKIIAPLTIEVGGQVNQIAGKQLFFMPCLIDPSLDYGLGVIVKGLEASAFDFNKFGADGDVNTDRFHVLAGHKMLMNLSSYEDIMTREATADELRANPAVRRIPLTDLKGQPISGGWKICSPRLSKGEHRSPGWDDVVGPCDEDGIL